MFKWKDEFSVNIVEIDNQHKNLFAIASRLYELVSIKDDYDHYDEIMNILEELKDYTIYHFEYEEHLMEVNGYQGIAAQKKEHAAFVEKIQSLEDDEVDSNQRGVTMNMMFFIANWIETHILKSDSNYKDFLNSKGIF